LPVVVRRHLPGSRPASPVVTDVVWALRASRFRDCPELPDRVLRSIASKAANTRLAIRANYGVWKAWCLAQRKPRKPYPAAPGDLAGFLQAQAPPIGVTRGGEFKLGPRGVTADGNPAKSYSTLSRYLGTLSKLHRDGNQPDPTKDPEVLAVWRVLGRGLARPAQKAPLTFEIIRRALITLPDTPMGKRDRALLILAYTLMARRSELVALDVENFAVHEDGSATVTFERQKTGEQGTNFLTPQVMAIVRSWLQVAQITTGPVFSRLDNARGIKAKRMTPQSVAGVFKRTVERLALPELDPRRISSHSARIGATHDLVEDGAPDAAIMRDAGWKTTRMVGMYSRGAKAKKGAMASRLTQLASMLQADADRGQDKAAVQD
jgi:integrase